MIVDPRLPGGQKAQRNVVSVGDNHCKLKLLPAETTRLWCWKSVFWSTVDGNATLKASTANKIILMLSSVCTVTDSRQTSDWTKWQKNEAIKSQYPAMSADVCFKIRNNNVGLYDVCSSACVLCMHLPLLLGNALIGSRALSFSDPYFHFTCLSVRHSVIRSVFRSVILSVCQQLRS